MNPNLIPIILSALATLSFNAQAATHDLTADYHERGDLGIEATAGLTASHGLVGGSLIYGVTDAVDVALTAGVDIYNTHLGVQGRYFFMPTRMITPLAYVGIASSNFKGSHSYLSDAGGGAELRFRSGLFLQAAAGWALFLNGEDRKNSPYGFFEARPITVGYRF